MSCYAETPTDKTEFERGQEELAALISVFVQLSLKDKLMVRELAKRLGRRHPAENSIGVGPTSDVIDCRTR